VAAMAREPLPNLMVDPPRDDPEDGEAPSMFSRPADAPDPLPPLRSSEHIAALHREWQRLSAPTTADESEQWRRLGRTAKRYVRRGLGSADHDIVADLIRAVDAISARCDELSERLSAQQVVVDEIANIFGEELTRIRSAVAPLIARESGSPPPEGP
jgi:hypothetical protein